MEKVVKIVSLHEQSSDFSYWKTKTPQERLAALEVLRQQYIKLNKIDSGIQKVCWIVKRKP